MEHIMKPQSHTPGQNLKFCRRAYGLTQKELGLLLGFSEKTAETRIGQYECGARNPKPDMIVEMAQILEVNKYALSPPSLINEKAAVQTLFRIDSIYGLNLVGVGDEVFITFPRQYKNLTACSEYLLLLKQLLLNGEISYADYRYSKHKFKGI